MLTYSPQIWVYQVPYCCIHTVKVNFYSEVIKVMFFEYFPSDAASWRVNKFLISVLNVYILDLERFQFISLNDLQNNFFRTAGLTIIWKRNIHISKNVCCINVYIHTQGYLENTHLYVCVHVYVYTHTYTHTRISVVHIMYNSLFSYKNLFW